MLEIAVNPTPRRPPAASVVKSLVGLKAAVAAGNEAPPWSASTADDTGSGALDDPRTSPRDLMPFRLFRNRLVASDVFCALGFRHYREVSLSAHDRVVRAYDTYTGEFMRSLAALSVMDDFAACLVAAELERDAVLLAVSAVLGFYEANPHLLPEGADAAVLRAEGSRLRQTQGRWSWADAQRVNAARELRAALEGEVL